MKKQKNAADLDLAPYRTRRYEAFTSETIVRVVANQSAWRLGVKKIQ